MAESMTYSQPDVDSGCLTCAGARYLRRVLGPDTDSNALRLVRCPACNPAPIDELAAAENTRAMSESPRQKRGKWWADA